MGGVGSAHLPAPGSSKASGSGIKQVKTSCPLFLPTPPLPPPHTPRGQEGGEPQEDQPSPRQQRRSAPAEEGPDFKQVISYETDNHVVLDRVLPL